MASATVHVNRAAVHLFLESPTGPVARGLRRLAACVESTAKRKAPVDTGLLRASIQSSIEVERGHLTIVVRAEAPYADFVEEGTGVFGPRGRPIKPRRARFMVWRGEDGQLIFARETRGMRARPFMAPAMTECLRKFGR